MLGIAFVAIGYALENNVFIGLGFGAWALLVYRYFRDRFGRNDEGT